MELQEIYNIIIACVPALTSIATCLGIVFSIVKTLTRLKDMVNANTEGTTNTIKELKAQNRLLQDQALQSQEQVNKLTRSVECLMYKIEDVENEQSQSKQADQKE